MAHWFRRHTKANILQAVTSSPETFLDLQQDNTSRDCRCMEFLHVLAAVCHCGFATDALRSMLLDPYGYYGVHLSQVLSVLAKAPGDMFLEGAESPKLSLLSRILATCRRQFPARLKHAADNLPDNILRHGLVPARGFSRDECRAVCLFQAELLRFAVSD